MSENNPDNDRCIQKYRYLVSGSFAGKYGCDQFPYKKKRK